MKILKLHSAEYEDNRILRINTHWIKMYFLHEPGTTHVILGDGYNNNNGYPIECVPVTETPEQIDTMVEGH